MELLDQIYPDSLSILNFSDISAPKDLKDTIDQLKPVKRFNDPDYYPSDMFDDNTYFHTHRLVWRIKTQPYIKLSDVAVRMAWVHDIPEILADDVPAVVQFGNEAIEKKVSGQEFEAAEKLMSREDFELFEDFERAKSFFRLGTKELPYNQEALVVKVIDFVDGNLVFWHRMKGWIQEVEYRGNPKEVSFMYSTQLYNKVAASLVGCADVEPEVSQACTEIFRESLRVCKRFAEEIPESHRIPHIQKALEEMELLDL